LQESGTYTLTALASTLLYHHVYQTNSSPSSHHQSSTSAGSQESLSQIFIFMTTIYADTRIPHIRPRPLLADHRSDEGIEDGMLVAALSAGLTGVYLARRGK